MPIIALPLWLLQCMIVYVIVHGHAACAVVGKSGSATGGKFSVSRLLPACRQPVDTGLLKRTNNCMSNVYNTVLKSMSMNCHDGGKIQ